MVKGGKDRRFAFETSAWGRCNLLNINLTVVKRQSDQRLVELLNRVRADEMNLLELSYLTVQQNVTTLVAAIPGLSMEGFCK